MSSESQQPERQYTPGGRPPGTYSGSRKPPPGSRKSYTVEHAEDYGGANAEGDTVVKIEVSWPDSNTGERDDVLVALARAYAKAVEQFTEEDLATWD